MENGSTAYLSHYGVKGMRWKNHVKVEEDRNLTNQRRVRAARPSSTTSSSRKSVSPEVRAQKNLSAAQHAKNKQRRQAAVAKASSTSSRGSSAKRAIARTKAAFRKLGYKGKMKNVDSRTKRAVTKGKKLWNTSSYKIS